MYSRSSIFAWNWSNKSSKRSIRHKTTGIIKIIVTPLNKTNIESVYSVKVVASNARYQNSDKSKIKIIVKKIARRNQSVDVMWLFSDLLNPSRLRCVFTSTKMAIVCVDFCFIGLSWHEFNSRLIHIWSYQINGPHRKCIFIDFFS